jgi:hypothetical protein
MKGKKLKSFNFDQRDFYAQKTSFEFNSKLLYRWSDIT